jgi:hypothetical protein
LRSFRGARRVTGAFPVGFTAGGQWFIWQSLGLRQFKDQFARFQTILARAQALRDRLKVIQGDFDLVMQERNELFGEGDELFTRLRLALKATHGPESSRLRDFGLKAPEDRPAAEDSAAIERCPSFLKSVKSTVRTGSLVSD